jgi:hypothetical protein
MKRGRNSFAIGRIVLIPLPRVNITLGPLFDKKYQSAAPYAIHYSKDTWLSYTDRIIRCWTYQFLHLRNSSTSRVEGSHAYIEKYIQTSTSDLLTVWNQIRLALRNQVDTWIYEVKQGQFQTLISASLSYIQILTKRRHAIS